MLKYLLMIIFLVPLCLLNNSWWLVHSLMFLFSFIFMLCIYSYCDQNMISYCFSVDYFSFSLILLKFGICSLMIMASGSVYLSSNHSMFLFLLFLFSLIMLYCCFASLSLLSFLNFFEASFGSYFTFQFKVEGYQHERIQAGIYLNFYTLVASLPLLMCLFKVYDYVNTLYFPLLFDLGSYYFMFYVFMILAFLVKSPMFLFHLLLPKAHVEAPISGSMILVGVLLKLGGYDIFRVMKIISFLGLKFNYFWLPLGLSGGVIVKFICFGQVEWKCLIAYSSVAHMSMVIGGLMTMNWWGCMDSLSVMVGHSLCSLGLFWSSNIIHVRLGSRSLLIIKGMVNLMPSMALWWFLLSSSNMTAPPPLNLVCELSLLNKLMYLLLDFYYKFLSFLELFMLCMCILILNMVHIMLVMNMHIIYFYTDYFFMFYVKSGSILLCSY
nr:NADH dehydrogenase subunit 4 [Kingdonella sp.]